MRNDELVDFEEIVEQASSPANIHCAGSSHRILPGQPAMPADYRLKSRRARAIAVARPNPRRCQRTGPDDVKARSHTTKIGLPISIQFEGMFDFILTDRRRQF